MAGSAIDSGPGLAMSRNEDRHGRGAADRALIPAVWVGQRPPLRCWLWADPAIMLFQLFMVSWEAARSGLEGVRCRNRFWPIRVS
jgi:hypothetical protein